jgi:predicted RNA methylase
MDATSTLFPDIAFENWQMMSWENIALIGLLSKLKPKVSLEVGIYYGGSLSITAQYIEKVYAIDIDPDVIGRFKIPANVEVMIADSQVAIPQVLDRVRQDGQDLELVFIDADHSAEGVKRDIEAVLKYMPRKPMVILAHDAGNPNCRRGILAADWNANPHTRWVELDFVPAQIIEHSVSATGAEIWGGFALAYLDPEPRTGDVVISQAARTGNACLVRACTDIAAVMRQ